MNIIQQWKNESGDKIIGNSHPVEALNFIFVVGFLLAIAFCLIGSFQMFCSMMNLPLSGALSTWAVPVWTPAVLFSMVAVIGLLGAYKLKNSAVNDEDSVRNCFHTPL